MGASTTSCEKLRYKLAIYVMMVATNGRTVTVFGGTDFLGSRIVRHLRDREFPVRIASRHPDRGHRQSGPDDPQHNL
jgi:nucleoside-diphosphate-sugar epimerase